VPYKVYVGNSATVLAGCRPKILDTNDYDFEAALDACEKPRDPMATYGIPPTLEKLVKHAKRFGVECVFETAQQHLADAELRSLDAELSRIDRKRRRVFPDDAKSELHTEIVRLAETLPVAQVAVQVGKSTSYIYSVLRMATEAGADRSIGMEGVALYAA
jgi:hypothetical protein